jgi:hypothetical protein
VSAPPTRATSSPAAATIAAIVGADAAALAALSDEPMDAGTSLVMAGGVGCRWMLRQFVVKTLPSTGFPDGHRACVGPSDHRVTRVPCDR